MPDQPLPPQRPRNRVASVGPVELIDAGSPVHASTTTITRGPSNLFRAGLIAALALVGVAGVFAVQSALSEPAGPQSPDEAVSALFGAIENEDLLGAAELLVPSERESLVEPSLELFSEIQRIGVVDDSADLNSVGGVDIEIDGLDYESTVIGTGVVNVLVTAGAITTTTTPSDLPLGDAVTDRLEKPIESRPSEIRVDDLADDDIRFTVVEEDGGWYVSLYYTAAEAIRDGEDLPAPRFGEGPTPVGAASPEAVIEAMAEELVELDWEGALTLMDPVEARVLYDYSTIYLVDWQEEANRSRAEATDVTWALDRLDVSATQRRDDTVVSIDGFDFRYADQFDSSTFSYDGSCFSWASELEYESICDDELGESVFGLAGGIRGVDAGFVVVERDGRWYLSLAPTVIGGITDQLGGIETGGFDGAVEAWADDLLEAFGLNDDGFQSTPFEEGTMPTTTAPADVTSTTGFSEAESGSETTGPPATDQSAPPDASTTVPFETALPGLAADLFVDDIDWLDTTPGWWLDDRGPTPIASSTAWGPDGGFFEIVEFASAEDAGSISLVGVFEPTIWDAHPAIGSGRRSVDGEVVVVAGRFVIWSFEDEASLELIGRQAEHLDGR